MGSTRVLFVCTGNTCRSPMAKAIAQELIARLPESSVEFSVDSAGVAAGEGCPASEQAVQALGERGIDLSGHQSKVLTPELIDQADIIFTMTPSHARAVIGMNQSCADKVFPLDCTQPIDDPFGCSVEVYRDVADQLEQLIGKRVEELYK